jgi:hypothetical protein
MHQLNLLYIVALYTVMALVSTFLYRRRRAKLTPEQRRSLELLPWYRDRIK